MVSLWPGSPQPAPRPHVGDDDLLVVGVAARDRTVSAFGNPKFFRGDSAFADPNLMTLLLIPALPMNRRHGGRGANPARRAGICVNFGSLAASASIEAEDYNLANFLRRLAAPKSVSHWTLTTLRERKIATQYKESTRALARERDAMLKWLDE